MILIKERIGKLIEDIGNLIYVSPRPITSYRMIKTNEKYKEVAHLNTEQWTEITNEQLWGGHREYYWFETYIEIPEEFQGACVVYELRTGREGAWDATNPQFTFYLDGERKQGLDVNHREVILTEKAEKGQVFHVVLSAYTGDSNFKLVMDSEIKILDRKTEKYYYDLAVPYNVARLLPDTDRGYIEIIGSLNESLNLLDLRREYTKEYYDSLQKAQEYLEKEFYHKYCGESKEKIYCVGHTHIDVAWLWTLSVTEDKAVRSFSTVLELMRQYPEYKFMSSQPQLYKYVKKNAPEIFEQIKERVAEGRWETEGGMFVEADCNISSGESLIRQILFGKRFFREEFGTDNKILWLPDVFGYSAALPQILKKTGIDYFMTTKISWNEFNKMPYDTFEWEGIDGTKVLTHFSPSRDYNKGAVEGGTETEHFTTYNAYINPSQVKGAWARYSQKDLNDEVLMSFGFGDGGGGPTRDMLENQRRTAKGIPGCPQTVMSDSLTFFEKLEQEVSNNKYLPTWVGELYLEYHRGTYTSMARNKKYNRKSEFLFENAELYNWMNANLIRESYPKKELEDSWEVILRNQFHDILPGSSIKEVYDDSKAEYESIKKTGNHLVQQALENIANHVKSGDNSIVVFNPNSNRGNQIVSFDRIENIKNPVVLDGNTVLPVQEIKGGAYIFMAANVPSKGYRTYEITEGDRAESALKVTTKCMENAYVTVTFAENGQISSIYDKGEGREILKPGQNGNVLMTYEDRPHNYDAWDVNNYYTEKSWEITQLDAMEVIEEGPVRATVKITRTYLDSTIEQYISLTNEDSEIVIRNEIDWKEKKIFMKALFPVDIHTDEASYEIQYGNVKRKTHYNTSWDFAKFEVCMHKWMDLSEDDYGVSMINDCKFGCSAHDGVIGLSMLKSATYPNPEADKEHHSFVFSIYPHKGDWKRADTISKAYTMNNPLTAIVKQKAGGELPGQYSAVSVDAPNVIIEVVKEAEDGKEMIIRLYEAYNRRTNVKMTFSTEINTIEECNMLEEKERELPCEGTDVSFIIKPYEIKTFKVSFQ
ncbi:MAG: alpha-mannosidase [Lachnospiraceae bacterium]|nr:alpha-mannosidase [Lachnospiraceae bacterium]